MLTLPDEVQFDESIDTRAMAPEDDFASPADPSIPRKGMARQEAGEHDSYYGAEPQSRDLEADQFRQQQNLQDAFSQPTQDQFASRGRQEPEMVGDDPDSAADADPISGNQPVVEPGEGDISPDEPLFAPELLSAAGITAEDAERDFGNPDALQSAVRMLDRTNVERGRVAIQSAPQNPAQEDIVVEEQPWELPAPDTGDEWDPDILKLANAWDKRTQELLAARDERLKQQEERIQQYEEQRRQEAAVRELEEFDTLVNSLPQEWTPLLGKGSAYELDRGSLAFRNRVQLEETMGNLQRGNLAYGRTAIPRDELLVRALPVAFPEAHKTAVRNEVIQQVQGRRQLMTHPPTQRRDQAMSRDAKAIQGVKEWFDKHNMSDDNDEEFEL